ncbi:MAG TPA: cytochrome c biogenesis protein CcdA [Methylocystis sp.]|nr:cytochrome c biogenesis protein CcdA [Methylocystis sp.]
MAADVSFPAAAAAGLLSFLSPCVLPLAPPYLAFIAGVTLEDLSSETRAQARRDIFLSALLFVLGFSTVFTALGATASFFGQALRQNFQILSYAAGFLIIAMGLHFMGFLKISFLYREKRAKVEQPVGLIGAYVIGLAFAFGWTPCIGPILTTILAIAGTQETVGRGAQLLAVYSLGLGVPFLLAALAIESSLGFIARFKRHFVSVERIIGALLVLTGIAFITGGVQEASGWLQQTFPNLWTEL